MRSQVRVASPFVSGARDGECEMLPAKRAFAPKRNGEVCKVMRTRSKSSASCSSRQSVSAQLAAHREFIVCVCGVRKEAHFIILKMRCRFRRECFARKKVQKALFFQI